MNISISRNLLNKYSESAEHIRNKLSVIPDTAVIAGSGIASSLIESAITTKIPYSEIPQLPKPSVVGHRGEVYLYQHQNKNALVFSGRFHSYEGRSLEELCSLVAITHNLGIKRLVITNAAGSLNPNFSPGDIMIIEDYIDLMFMKNHSSINVFNAESDHQNNHFNKSEYSKLVKEKMISEGIPFKNGVYAAVSGPTYETRAEIRMLRKLGADAVGMSTVPEANFAKKLGIDLVIASLLTNSAKEVHQKVSHQEVIDVASQSADNVRKFIECAITV